MKEQEVYQQLNDILINEFDIDASDVRMDANLYEDLDLDSIDAVDLVVRLQQITGKKIKPEEFKGVRTVADVTRSIQKLFD